MPPLRPPLATFLQPPVSPIFLTQLIISQPYWDLNSCKRFFFPCSSEFCLRTSLTVIVFIYSESFLALPLKSFVPWPLNAQLCYNSYLYFFILFMPLSIIFFIIGIHFLYLLLSCLSEYIIFWLRGLLSRAPVPLRVSCWIKHIAATRQLFSPWMNEKL